MIKDFDLLELYIKGEITIKQYCKRKRELAGDNLI